MAYYMIKNNEGKSVLVFDIDDPLKAKILAQGVFIRNGLSHTIVSVRPSNMYAEGHSDFESR